MSDWTRKFVETALANARAEPREWASASIKVTPDANVYGVGHLVRYEKTFATLRERLEGEDIDSVMDLGTCRLYHPELFDQFPNAEFHFSGPKSQGENYFELDLELEPLPLEDDSIQLTLLLEVIEHFYEDPMFCLSEINRVTELGGWLMITTPNILSLRATFGSLLGYAPYFHGKYERTRGARRHVHEYAPYQLEDTVRSAGFEPTLWTENVYTDEPSALLPLLEEAGFSHKFRGDTLFCLAKKVGPVVERYPKMTYV